MDLNPESLDRHPFRIRKRGYDIMQVRKLLREVGEEMRARQRARDGLAADSDPRARAEREAEEVLARAEARADEIVIQSRQRSSRTALAGSLPEQIVEDARIEAARLIDEAEATARERSTAVLAEAQIRLDRLIDRERDVVARLRLAEQRLRELSADEIVAGGRDLRSSRPEPRSDDGVIEFGAVEVGSGDSLAAFMKAAVRDEIEATSSGS
ncbi:MAG: hypothetical protein HKO87_02715 [Acidimicrobiia bacterium]|nr:hypothetical protein [Acidimicrobiia bacterium]